MNNQFAVIGLGLFGSALCEELQRQDAEVLATDRVRSQRVVVEKIATPKHRRDTDAAIDQHADR